LQGVAKRDKRLVEVHPEVSFCEMAGATLEDPKLTWNGQRRRLELLRGEGIELPPYLSDAADVPPADLIDAAAAAWSARRVARETAKPFPKDYTGGTQPVIWR
jgi:predicted RNase H-like nuclease